MKITVTTQILDGNLGDGWNDNYSAAQALAEYTEKIWLADLADYTGHEIEIDIDVEQNTSGVSRSMDVCLDSYEDTSYDLEQEIRDSLTDENTIWENFCGSDVAEKYFSEDD